jgi:putative ATPase
VGYRYPHAFAEHWVAQQYLPGALQGEVFWKPGGLGWEGALGAGLQRRRAAQLAAAAEADLEQGILLTTGPEDPALQRWLRRQIGSEGQRLERLRQRFWQGACWQRHDRCLVVNARSLLWSLDPLDATPEGGVVITVAAEAERGRLEAQLQVLDQLRRPRLLCVPSAHPEALIAALEPGERFEWIVGRSSFQELDEAGLAAWLDCVGKLAAPRAQLRWLQSMPLIGPAGALAELMRQRQRCGPEELATLVQQAAVWESGGLGSGPGADAVQQCLEARGWSVEAEQWREPLSVKLSAGLRQRWFGEGASYGRQLGAALGSDAAERLERLSAELEGAELAQALQHTLLMAMKKAPGNPGPEG